MRIGLPWRGPLGVLRACARFVLLSRPVLALVRALARACERVLAAEREPTGGDTSPVEALVAKPLELASPGAKQRFFAWVDERARKDENAVEYAERIFELYRLELVKHRGALEGLRILELGPGYTLVSGLLYVVHGARSYVAADLYPFAAKDSSTYRALREHLAERPPLVPFPGLSEARAVALRRLDEVVDLSGAEARFDEARVAWRYPVDASALPFPDASFDVVLSNASFEHFEDPGRAARECARVLAPGGLGLHQIDMRDHRDFSRPLEFLRYGDDEWRDTWRSYQRMFTNRLRKGDFVRLFEEAGTRVESAVANMKAEVDAALRARLDARFRDLPREELEAAAAFFVVRKSA